MATLRVNIIANYIGQAWLAIMGIIFMPMYIHLLGIEAFGLVGVMLSFQAIFQLFDFGIGGTVNRELSRYAHQADLRANSRDLVRSSEIFIWGIAAFIALALWLVSSFIANYWLNLESISSSQAATAVALMGVAIALLWPSTFYTNCLSGLEKQPQMNIAQIIFTTLRYAGVVPVLWYSATIEAFLSWYALIGVLQSLATGFMVWHYLPRGQRKPRCKIQILKNTKEFSGGLFAVGILALGVSQIDRVFLTSLRPLEEMGYYTLALSVAAGLGRIVQPMFNAVYPRFSRLVAQRKQKELETLYHLSSQYLAIVLAAVTSVLVVFAYDVLFLWTGDTALASKVAPPMQLLVIGSALNGLINIPYALQLAHGWTRLAIGLNVVSLLLGIPVCFWAVQEYGMLGAAFPWLLGNFISVIIGIPLMHRHLLYGHALKWFLKDNFPPLLVGILCALVLSTLPIGLERNLASFIKLAMICFAVLAACFLSHPKLAIAITSKFKIVSS
jgi:O-antigen/teichoic acid export membrane protein